MYTLCMNMTYDKKWVCYKRCPEKKIVFAVHWPITIWNSFSVLAGFVWFIRLRNSVYWKKEKEVKKKTLSNVHERLSFVNVISFSPYQLQITQMRIERKNENVSSSIQYRFHDMKYMKNWHIQYRLNLCLWKMKKKINTLKNIFLCTHIWV